MRDKLACLLGAIYATTLLTAMSGCIIIDILENSNLHSLAGLDNLESVEDDLMVSNNDVLPTCEAQDLAGRMIANGFSGTINICGNDETADWEE